MQFLKQQLGRFSEVIDLTEDWRLLSLSAELLCSLLALSPLFPPSGRLSAELSSSSLACSPFLFDDDDDDHTLRTDQHERTDLPSCEGCVCVYTLILS